MYVFLGSWALMMSTLGYYLHKYKDDFDSEIGIFAVLCLGIVASGGISFLIMVLFAVLCEDSSGICDHLGYYDGPYKVGNSF